MILTSAASINRAYLLLGSNIEAEKNFPASVTLLNHFGRVISASQVWETQPIGCTVPGNFLNAAVLLETTLAAVAIMKAAIPYVESTLKRVRTSDKNAPRTIDVDLMLFNAEVLNIDRHHIPAPQVLEWSFVAALLAQISPDYVHPESGETLAQIAKRQMGDAACLLGRNDVVLLPKT
jgi:2-amino-4-hydroxy-6-hydroxymethyldihydropteridine diphosphokinase